MVEHVGPKNYRTYLETVDRCLAGSGLFLCQGIANHVSCLRTDPWITRYIFPNSILPSAAWLSRAAEGLFVLEDVHNFGACYDRTLMAWERNFRRSWPGFQKRYGDRFYRMWRFYPPQLVLPKPPSGARSLQLFQFVWSKGGTSRGIRSAAMKPAPPPRSTDFRRRWPAKACRVFTPLAIWRQAWYNGFLANP